MKAVLFDLDRTLIDVQSFTDYAAAVADVEAVTGQWEDPPTPPTGWDGPTRRAMGILVSLHGDARWQAVSDLIERHEAAAIIRSVPMPGLAEAMAQTAHRRRAVVTLLPETVAHRVLAHHGLDLAVVVGRRPDLAVKPAPDQLVAACRELGIERGAATMVGDSTWDSAAAAAAGCGFVGVTNGAAGEFGPGTVTASTIDAAVALLD